MPGYSLSPAPHRMVPIFAEVVSCCTNIIDVLAYLDEAWRPVLPDAGDKEQLLHPECRGRGFDECVAVLAHGVATSRVLALSPRMSYPHLRFGRNQIHERTTVLSRITSTIPPPLHSKNNPCESQAGRRRACPIVCGAGSSSSARLSLVYDSLLHYTQRTN